MLKKKYQKIKLIIYDFDGVMTDNKFILDINGNESVVLNRGDGMAINYFKKLGLSQMILSTEKNKIVKTRAKKLDIDCFFGIDNKLLFFLNYLKKNKLNSNNCCYIGNDLNDLDTMSLCKYRFCPEDAQKTVKKISNKVLSSKGGDGVIRELYDLLVL